MPKINRYALPDQRYALFPVDKVLVYSNKHSEVCQLCLLPEASGINPVKHVICISRRSLYYVTLIRF
jgi:hypothetical protein